MRMKHLNLSGYLSRYYPELLSEFSTFKSKYDYIRSRRNKDEKDTSIVNTVNKFLWSISGKISDELFTAILRWKYAVLNKGRNLLNNGFDNELEV